MDSPRASLQSRASLADSLESAEPAVQISKNVQVKFTKFSLIQFSLSYPKSISSYRMVELAESFWMLENCVTAVQAPLEEV